MNKRTIWLMSILECYCFQQPFHARPPRLLHPSQSYPMLPRPPFHNISNDELADKMFSSFTARAGDTIRFDSLKLVNNEWGAPRRGKFNICCISRPGKNFGWYWNRQNPHLRPGSACLQPIYPSIRAGGNPWEQSTSPQFPIRMADLKSLRLRAAYDYLASPTGVYNLSYDMFLLDSDKSCPNR